MRLSTRRLPHTPSDDMAEFLKSIDPLLMNEGGLTVNAADAGGTTNFGISQRMLSKWQATGKYLGIDIRLMTREQAVQIYREQYWEFDRLVDQPVATKLLDMKVNMGPEWAFTLLQRGLVSRWKYKLPLSGKLDDATLAATNAVHEEDLLNELRAQSVLHYAGIANSNPSQKQFLMGWVRRACQ